jgi:hypothetical protein
MKPTSSAITTFQKEQSQKTGQQVGAHGAGTRPSGKLSEAQTVDLTEALQQALMLRSAFSTDYMQLRRGKMSLETFKAKMPSPSTMSQWQRVGDDAKILALIGCVFEIWDHKKGETDVTPVAWLHNLRGFPLVSIHAAYRFYCEHPTRWRPDPGTFRQKVADHATHTKTLIFKASEKDSGT